MIIALMAETPKFDESRYFRQENAARRAELRDRLDLAAKRLAEQTSIADALETDDKLLIERIHALGFNGDSVRVFDLLPLVHVAWADGRVQRDERATIFSILEQRGIQPDSDATLLIESLLERRPSDTYLGESLAVLRALLGKNPQKAENVVDLCREVADASGGLLGLGNRTSEPEKELIERVAEALGDAARDRFRRDLGSE